MARIRVALLWLLVVACGSSLPVSPDASPSASLVDAGTASEALACPSPERSCSCPDGMTGRQVCFEPNAVWSQCGCSIADSGASLPADGGVETDAGALLPDAGGVDPINPGRRDGGFAECPAPLTCSLRDAGIGVCTVGRLPPPCEPDGGCALPGAACRPIQGSERCIRLCSR